MMSVETKWNEHLSEEALHVFLEAPDDHSAAELRQHLMACADCRAEVSRLQIAQEFVRAHVETISRAAQPSPLRSQLHQLTHEMAMADMASELVENGETASKTSWWAGLLHSLSKALRAKVSAFSLPATALAAFCAAYLTVTTTSQPTDGLIEFQDAQGLVMTKTGEQPGLGFFHGAGKKEEKLVAYAGFLVSADRSGRYIQISWPEVDGARRYEVTLHEVSNNVRQQVDQISTDKTVWLIDRTAVQSGILYRLTLTGTTDKDFTFRHTGGFVLRN